MDVGQEGEHLERERGSISTKREFEKLRGRYIWYCARFVLVSALLLSILNICMNSHTAHACMIMAIPR